MQYQLIPVGDIWADGMVAIPKRIITKSLRFASEYQIKALLLIANSGGVIDSKNLAKELGCTEADANEFLEFWVGEGLLNPAGEEIKIEVSVSAPKQKEAEKPAPKREIDFGPPQLTRSTVAQYINENGEIAKVLNEAEMIKGTTLSHTEQELVINMHEYFGLPAEVIVYILQYYYTKRRNGEAVGTAYVEKIAKNWSEEGITDALSADEKMKELETSDKNWKEITVLTGLRHKSPTIKQREMVSHWCKEFSMTMISLACDIMKENTEKPTLKYVDTVLKNWKKKGIATPEDVEKEEKAHLEQKAKKQKGNIDKTYDINDIANKAMMNDDYDI